MTELNGVDRETPRNNDEINNNDDDKSSNKNINERQVAFKITINQILNSKYIKEEGWLPNYIEIDSKRISRINLIAGIISIDENENNVRIGLDDGTGSINAISFEKVPGIDEAKVGSIVLIICKPRTYNEEKYLLPESIREIDKAWLGLRKKEIGEPIENEPEESTNHQQTPKEEMEITPHERVLQKIGLLDNGDGIGYDELCSKINIEEIDEILNALLERGEIFEISPGKYKVLE